jgi:predicted transcriptional regulator
MRSHSLGCAIIVDHNHNPLAIFTEQCVIALIQEMGSLDGSAVGRFADRDFLSAKLSDPILQVWELMQIRGAKLVCVTDDAGRLVGLTNQQRVAAYLAENI